MRLRALRIGRFRVTVNRGRCCERARLQSLCRNSECRKKVEQGTAPAAKRRHGKARHGSAGKQKWNKVESRRDDTPVATQTLQPCRLRTAPFAALAAEGALSSCLKVIHETRSRKTSVVTNELSFPAPEVGARACPERAKRVEWESAVSVRGLNCRSPLRSG